MNKELEYSLPRHGLSQTQKNKADKELIEARIRSLSKIGSKEKAYADLISLKFKLIEYVNIDVFNEEFLFSKFLKRYVSILDISRRQLAKDLSIHETKFSRLINNKENPGLAILYRLEEHSNKLIPASLLWKLVNMKLEVEINNNTNERKKQSKFVKNKVKLRSA